MKTLCFLTFLICNTFIFSQKSIRINITNSININRKNIIVEIPLDTLLANGFSIVDTNNIVIKDKQNRIYTYQFLINENFAKKILIVQADIYAHSSLQLFILKGKIQAFESKVYARFVPERLDDFAWENDKIAFRTYGPALEKTNQNGKGIDVWSKRTNKLIINKWYASKDYHNDKGEGCDMYKVGYSLGAGDISPYINDSIILLPNFSSYKIIANGPLRTVFELYYPSWNAFQYQCSTTKRISLDAGSQFNKIEVNYDINNYDSLPAMVGIVRRHHAGINFLDEQKGIMAYWEPSTEHDGLVAVACILPIKDYDMAIKKGHLLSPVTLYNNKIFTYYAGASWNKAERIINNDQWIKHVSEQQQFIEHPLQINILK